MTQDPKNLPDTGDHARSDFWITVRHWLTATLIAVGVISGGTVIIKQQTSELEARQQYDILQLGSTLRARLMRELNSVLYLTSGLNSYLAVRYSQMQRDEVEAILAGLYSESRHVRNFGIAVGYTLTYIHPIKGNEKAIGLHYPNVPARWPDIQRAIVLEKPMLIGPLKLVQGGNSLIYRVPIFIQGKYWGLVSTVIDSDSLLDTALKESLVNEYAIAIRGKNGQGMKGGVFRGDAALFSQPGTQLIDIDVPGGKWVLAIHSNNPSQQQLQKVFNIMIWFLGLMLGWFAYTVLEQRSTLARLALYDGLTGLPNRVLVQDRVDHAMSIQRRDQQRNYLLLFIDLDGFKQVNDQMGHKAGDIVLQQVAQRIARVLRDTDTVSRWGGDEFIVFMEQVDPAMAQTIIEKIRTAVEMPVNVGNREARVGASIGTAVAPADGTNLAVLARAADERMYAEKRRRKSDEGVR